MANEIGFELRNHEVLRRPLITEKTTYLSERRNCYVFQVDMAATKHTIKAAVEEHWKVRVISVRIQNRVGKSRRFKTIIGETSAVKRALVTLHEDDRISLF